MQENRQDDVEEETVRLLQAALGHRPTPRRPPPKGRLLYLVGVGLLFLVPFFVVPYVLQWIQVKHLDQGVWVGGLIALALLAGWQIDTIKKESDLPDEQNNSLSDCKPTLNRASQSIRRVK